MILADANLLSETSKPQRDQRVIDWIELNFAQLYLVTPVLAELRYGCAKLPQSKKRRELEIWLDDLIIQLDDRIVLFDQPSAEMHGNLRAHLQSIGKTCSPSDSYIAAMGLALDCPIATRNVKHFENTGVKILNPWGE